LRRAIGKTLSLVSITALAGLGAGQAAVAAPAQTAQQSYVVVYEQGASAAAAHAAIKAAGGTIVSEQAAIGVAFVKSTDSGFSQDAVATAAVKGVARERTIGKAPADGVTAADLRDRVEKEANRVAKRRATEGRTESRGTNGLVAEPLAPLQWDMQMIGATVDGSYAVQPGSREVRVGIIDTGVDGHHPDIAPNFNARLSRNFTVDIPLIDGDCATDPDGSCVDPADVDEDGHGTHVASTIGSPINGLGMAGVAPKVSLVNIRAGQDSGFFFLSPTINALMYAADIGVDVVNMSFFTDPWLYNCGPDHPAQWHSVPTDPTSPLVNADTPAEMAEQATIIDATNRALHFAHEHGVTLVAAAGNEHTNLGDNPKLDTTSPDFPPGTDRSRIVSNDCLDMPTEGLHVLSVSSVGPSGRKADYSNFGMEQIDVAAPGGWFRDGLGTPSYRTVNNLILAAFPESVGRASGDILPNGDINPDALADLVKDCNAAGVCAYYQWIQGTSMASPHAAGVAALIVSQFGHRDRHGRGLTLLPNRVAEKLRNSAVPHACPPGGVEDYTLVGRDWTNTCTGTTEFNDFYGHGIVNALNAVS
jgi:subtilisin family serine protease